MKNYIIIPCTLLLASIICLSSFKCTKSESTDCTLVLCTAVFAQVSVHIDDRSMTAIGLTVYAIRNSTGEKIILTQSDAAQGNYVVYDDSYRFKITNRIETFTFVGMKGTTKVFSETYQVKADCCHVSKVSGKDSLIIP